MHPTKILAVLSKASKCGSEAAKVRKCTELKKDILPVLVVHGGVGNDLTKLAPHKMKDIKLAACLGYKAMLDSGNVLHGIEEAMNFMEESTEFNIGVGSMLNMCGEVEMDASFMDGDGPKAGGVGCVKDILHPCTLARGVMDYTPHVLISAEGTKYFANESKMKILKAGALVTATAEKLLRSPNGEIGNAGVIAVDQFGHVAAATGNGGKSGKYPGALTEGCRVGCGIYADNTVGAIAVAGNSDHLLRSLLAFKIHKTILFGKTPMEALYACFAELQKRFSSFGGGIVVTIGGEVAVHFNTSQMAWAYQRGEEVRIGLNKGEDRIEKCCVL